MDSTISQMMINEGDQYEFSNLERPKKLNDSPAQVWFSNKDKGVAVLRQLTKTGMVSRDESKQFVLSFDVIHTHGRLLDGDERVYPDLPSDLKGLLRHTSDEGTNVSDARKGQIVEALEDRCDEIDERIDELQSMQKSAQMIIRQYESLMSGNGNNGSGKLSSVDEEGTEDEVLFVEEEEDDVVLEAEPIKF